MIKIIGIILGITGLIVGLYLMDRKPKELTTTEKLFKAEMERINNF